MRKRRSYEAGHRPKILIIVDETPEADRALYYAAKRAARIGAAMVTLSVIAAQETQVWLGVGDMMRADALKAAEDALDKAAERIRTIAGIEPERVIREGHTAQEILKLVEADEDIYILILAAGTSTDGPGPLVSSLASKTIANYPIPVTIVPGSLDDSDIDALAG
jgi:nucleotide-binding universal stress UspA family protein